MYDGPGMVGDSHTGRAGLNKVDNDDRKYLKDVDVENVDMLLAK